MSRHLIELATCSTLLLAACGHDTSTKGAAPDKHGVDLAFTPAPAAGASGSATLTFQPTVHVVEQKAGAAALVAESSNGHGLVFNASSPEIASLKAGDVLMIKGLIARKILAVERTGDEILVVTDQATLGDLVKSGDLKVEAPIKFGTLHAQTEPRRHSWTDLIVAPAYADTKAAAGASRDALGNLVKGARNYAIGDWKITSWNASPVGDRLDLDLDMHKDTGGGFIATVGMHGHINNFNVLENIHAGADSTTMEMSLKNLSVEMTFDWEIAKNSPGIYTTEDRIKLPAPISIPLAQYLGGLPVFLEISAALLIHPAVTGGGELVKGSLKLTYSGSVGLTSKSGDVDGTSDGGGEVSVVEDSGLSPVAPVGMVLAIAAPRLELQLGLKKIFPIIDGASDKIAAIDNKLDALAKAHLSPEAYDALSKSPLGTAILSNAIKSEADAYAQVMVTEGVTRTGSTALIACSRIQTNLTVQVGVNGNLFGVGGKEHSKDVLTHDWLRVEPPGAMPCADISK